MEQPLDIEQPDALLAYLRETKRLAPGETPRVKVLAGGVSNRTVLVERDGGEAWVMKQALPKLRVAVDWFSHPRRIEREALALRYLPELAPEGSITPLVFEDPANHLLAMQAVPQPHENWKTMLLAGRVDFGHVEQFGRLLGRIHGQSQARADELAAAFDDRSFFESLRLEPYYQYTASQVPEARQFLDRLVEQTRATRCSLVHGDYSPKNVLVRDDRLILLDHEVIHWGDPAFDLGFALAHLLSKAHHLAARRDLFQRAALEFWTWHREGLGDAAWGRESEARVASHTLGCLLARVAGRSPLEYLSAEKRERQRALVVEMMRENIWDHPGAVIAKFLLRLGPEVR